jgi:hypothetical protein
VLPGLRSFAVSELRSALAFLELTGNQASAVTSTLRDLRAEAPSTFRTFHRIAATQLDLAPPARP